MDDTRRCTAHRKNGDRCKKAAIRGGTVCGTHGGSAPQVKNKARQRIMEAADPAAARLVELMESQDERISLAAARDLLDRAGHKAPTVVEITSPEQAIEILKRDIEDMRGRVVD